MSIGYLSSEGMNNVFNQWSQVDPNINNYGFGQFYNENGEPKAKQVYPAVWINPTSTSVGEYALTRSYQILIYDLVFIAESGESNQNKVISDCEEIAFRLVRFLRLKSDLFTISTTPSIVPFNDRFLDDVSGVILTVDVDFNAESSDCDDPTYNFNIKSNDI